MGSSRIAYSEVIVCAERGDETDLGCAGQLIPKILPMYGV